LKSEIERGNSLSALDTRLAAPVFAVGVANVVEADSAGARFVVVVDDAFEFIESLEGLFQFRGAI